MALQLYMGNSGSGKSYALYSKIIKEASENKKEKFLILVPEQFTMQTQKKLAQMSPCGGIINIDILSFKRLAYRIFEEVGCNNTPVIDEIGKSFIVRRAARDHVDDLAVFGANLEKIGFVNEIKSLISEFIQYDINIEKIDQVISLNKKNKNLCKKLEDMKIIFQAFYDYKEEKYITSEEILDVLCSNIFKSNWLKGATVVLDCYTGFTPIQKRLVEKIMVMSKNIYITVTFDSSLKINSNYPDYHLFHMSSVMLGQIEKMAENTCTKRLPDCIFAENKRHEKNKTLRSLEKNIFRIKKEPFIDEEACSHINLSVCKNPVQEVEFAAGEINYLVRECGYRFRDIAVVSGDMAVYGTYIKYIFNKYNINCFVDKKIAVLNHPAVEFLRAALRIVLENFSYNSMMRFIRSDFSGIDLDEADELDNYLVATGIKSKNKWKSVFVCQTKQIDEQKLERLNEIRDMLFSKIKPFYDVISRKSTTVLEKTTALFTFLQKFDLQQNIETMQHNFEEEGQLVYAKEYSQIYKAILDVLDSIVELLGDEKISCKEYEKLLESGFVEQTVGIIPPGCDEVVFGDIERSRFGEIKALFVLGANDGLIPKSADKCSILSELDRESLSMSGIELSSNSREQYFNQRYYLYLNLTKPSDKLYISFSKTNQLGEGINPSYLIDEVHGIFPKITIANQEEKMKCSLKINNRQQGWDFVVANINKINALDNDEVKTFFDLFRYFEREGKGELLNQLRNADNLKRIEGKIDAAVAKALYGDVIEGSVTRFEQYAKCAYSYFLSYGLQLREREEAGFGGIDFGNIMHSVLEMYSKYIEENNLSWADEADEEIIDSFIERAVTQYGNQAIYFSCRDKYQIERLKRMTKRTLWALRKQFSAGKFKPSEFEVKFRSVPEMVSDGTNKNPIAMAMSGRIDRVDVVEIEDKVYVKVVDYKTGNDKFKLLNVYYGTSLQLMVYLDEAIKIESKKSKYKQKTILPAAVLYYRIKDPILESNNQMDNYEEDILNELKVDGLISEEKSVLESLDKNFADSPISYKSPIVPIDTLKGGNLSAASKTVRKDTFDIIRKYVMRKAYQIGEDIVNGDIAVNPYLTSSDDACKFCNYKSICRFDENIYGVRNIESMKENEIIAAMEKALSDKGEVNNGE